MATQTTWDSSVEFKGIVIPSSSQIVLDNWLMLGISGVIIAILLISLILIGYMRSRGMLEVTANIMTSLGVFGTFIGILMGLLEFNTLNLERSVPNLLAGLTTAFVTSVVGLLCSVILKSIDTVLVGFEKNPVSTDSSRNYVDEMTNELLIQSKKLSAIENQLSILGTPSSYQESDQLLDQPSQQMRLTLAEILIEQNQYLEEIKNREVASNQTPEILEEVQLIRTKLEILESIESIQDVVEQVGIGLQHGLTTNGDRLDKLTAAVAGDSENTLIGQIKDTRLAIIEESRHQQNAIQDQRKVLETIDLTISEQQKGFINFAEFAKEHWNSINQQNIQQREILENVEKNGTELRKELSLIGQDLWVKLEDMNSQRAQIIADLAKLVDVSESQIDELKQFSSKTSEHLEGIQGKQDLNRDELEQIKNKIIEQETAFSEFSKELWNQMREFADILSKSATDQVVEALKKVIEDFNENLMDQFGDNFKELNSAVGRMVEWLDKYQIQVESMIKQYEEGTRAITLIQGSVSQIETDTQKIPDTMGTLREVMETNQQQLSNLEQHLLAFAEMKEKAITVLPEMQKHVNQVLEDIHATSNKAEKFRQELLQKNSENLKLHQDETQRLVDKFIVINHQSASDIKEAFVHGTNEITEQLRISSENISSSFSTESEKMVTILNEGTGEIGQTLKLGSRDLSDAFESGTQHVGETIQIGMEQLSAAATNGANEVSGAFSTGTAEVKKSMSDSSESLVETFAISTNQLKENFEISSEILVNKISESTKKLEKSIDKGSNQLSEKFSEGSDNLREAATHGANEVAKAMQSGTTELSESLKISSESLVRTFDNSCQQVKDQFENSSTILVQKIKESSEQLNESISGGATKISESVAKSSIKMEEAGSKGAEKISNAFSEGSEGLRSEFKLGTKSIRESLEGTADELRAMQQEMAEAISSILEETNHSFKIINKSLTSTSKEFKDAAVSLSDQSKEVLTYGEDILATIKESKDAFNEAVNKTIQLIEVGNIRAQNEIKDAFKKIMYEQESNIRIAYENYGTTVTSLMEKAGSAQIQAANEHLRIKSEAIEKEVNKIMSEMGNALAKITGTFTSDYEKLVDKMNEIVKYKNAA